jgi:hypothetical protein
MQHDLAAPPQTTAGLYENGIVWAAAPNNFVSQPFNGNCINLKSASTASCATQGHRRQLVSGLLGSRLCDSFFWNGHQCGHHATRVCCCSGATEGRQNLLRSLTRRTLTGDLNLDGHIEAAKTSDPSVYHERESLDCSAYAKYEGEKSSDK